MVPEAIRLMAGDFDGDPLIFMCYGDKSFKIKPEIYAAEKKRLESELMEDFSISKINLEDLYKTDNELLNLAEEEHTKLRKQKAEVPRVGGLRKNASFAQDSMVFETEEIVENAIFLEEGLKDTMPGKFTSKITKEEQLKIWERSAKKECVIKILWKKYREGDLKGNILDDILGMQFLPNDKIGLYRSLISGIERQ